MTKLIFDEKTHTYYLKLKNDKKKLISVTQLLQKHNLSPDYSMIPIDRLSKKAERGKIIHEELENYIKYGVLGFTEELYNFIDVCKIEKITPLQSEIKVYNKDFAGTIDITGKINGKCFIGDFKTTSSAHLKSVSWQLSLYEFLAKKRFKKLLCFHFRVNKWRVIEVPRIPRKEIKKLLKFERKGLIYKEGSYWK